MSDYNAKKHDMGKLRMDLFPVETMESISAVLTYGAEKYAAHSWRTVPDAIPRYVAAMLRHYVAWKKGEMLDAESGLPHTSHMACNAMFIDALVKQDVE